MNGDHPNEGSYRIDAIPSQGRRARAAARSRAVLAAMLNRICWNEMRGVEALSIATRYFSRFPKAAVSFARHNADEARHVVMFASRALELGATITPYPGRAAVLELMPGFKREAKGDEDALAEFAARGYVEESRGLQFFEAMLARLERDPITQRILERVATDERRHVESLREVLDDLTGQGYGKRIADALARHKLSTEIEI